MGDSLTVFKSIPQGEKVAWVTVFKSIPQGEKVAWVTVFLLPHHTGRARHIWRNHLHFWRVDAVMQGAYHG